MTSRTRPAHHALLKKAIFTICGSASPTASCLADIGRRAAEIAGRNRPWGDRHLYALLHVDRYDAAKYPITDELLNALLALSGREATNGKRVVKVYARHVRAGAVVFGHSRKCARRRCAVHFVSDAGRLYCSEQCRRQTENFRRKQRRLEQRLRRRKGAQARGRKVKR